MVRFRLRRLRTGRRSQGACCRAVAGEAAEGLAGAARAAGHALRGALRRGGPRLRRQARPGQPGPEGPGRSRGVLRLGTARALRA
ncbi:MAG: hypothetical protein FJ291_03385 [Planctomycetes bacterium]|nr:hypothetical protein [Planctomycetota bacterium]